MSGELGAYDTVVGNMGDRNDLDLWWKGGSLVSFNAYRADYRLTRHWIGGSRRGGVQQHDRYNS
jgi:hypothetical protein